MSEANKPSWDSAPEWANWLACDGNGKYKGQWWWFDAEPGQKDYFPGEWYNNGEDAKFSGFCANGNWVEENWATSAEERPAKPKNEYLTSPDKKRVTLFMEFTGPVTEEHELANNIAEALLYRVQHGVITPGIEMVNKIIIAVGVEKMSELGCSDHGEFKIIKESNDE